MTTPGYVSNSQLASRISALVDRWDTREGEMIDLLTQEAGEVTVTDGLGRTHTLPSFRQLMTSVTEMVDELTGESAKAAEYAQTALQHRNAAAGLLDDTRAVRDDALAVVDDVRAEGGRQIAAATAVVSELTDEVATLREEMEDDLAVVAAGLREDAEEVRAGLRADAGGYRETLEAIQAATTVERDAAAASARTAQGHVTAAVGEVAKASAHVATAAGHVTTALDHANTAGQRAGAAADSAAASANSASTADAHRAAAATSVTQAGQHSATASGHAGAAASSASSASAERNKAEEASATAARFANAPAGTEVTPGEYSARHWAAQAAASVTGALVYMGTWDASTGNYPATPTKGHFYKVSGEATIDGVHWRPNDQALYSGTEWEKIDNTDQVSSVAGRQGDVKLVAGDIGGLGGLATRDDVAWGTHITGKPSTFPAAAHSHTWDSITGKPGAFPAAAHAHTWDSITGKPATFPASGHRHGMWDIDGLQAALDERVSKVQGAVAYENADGLIGTLGHAVSNGDALGSPGSFYTTWNFGTNGSRDGQLSWHYGAGTDLYFRSRYDTGNAWKAWVQLWHSENFNPNTKANLSGANFTGAVSSKGQLTTSGYAGNANNGLLYLGDGYVYNRAASGDMEFYTTGGGYATLKSSGQILTTNMIASGTTTFGAVRANAVQAGFYENLNGDSGLKYRVGNDAEIHDTGIANAFAVVGMQNPALGVISFGNTGACHVGFDGSTFNVNGSEILHRGNFNPASKQAARGPLNAYAATVVDWNDAIDNGWWMSSSGVNAPGAGWFIGHVVQHNAGWVTQEIHPFTAGAGRGSAPMPVWKRHKQNNTWGSWYRVDSPAVFVQPGDPAGDAAEGTLWVW